MDWICERRLLRLDADLHGRYVACVIALESMLDKYQVVFPTYTDHSMLHCMDVIAFCSQLLGEEGVGKLSADELYVLLMSVLVHDVGMGVSERQHEAFISEHPEMSAWRSAHPNETRESLARRFHHELSAAFIRKYADFLDLPNERYAEAVAQVARGHRKADLFDENAYPSRFEVAPGRHVCLPYLAALIRLADELDIGSSRNIDFMFDLSALTDPSGIDAFNTHNAIRRVGVGSDLFIVETRATNRDAYFSAIRTVDKLREVLDYCVKLVDERTPFTIRQRQIIHNISLCESALLIEQFKFGGRLMVSLGGKLDADTTKELTDALSRSTDGVELLVLDLYMLNELGSEGMRAILGLQKFLSKRGGRLVISHLSEGVKEVMRVSGFYDLFTPDGLDRR